MKTKIQFLVVIIILSIFTLTISVIVDYPSHFQSAPKLKPLMPNSQMEQGEQGEQINEQEPILQRNIVGGYNQFPLDTLNQEQKNILTFVQTEKPEIKGAQLVKYQEQVVAGKNIRLTYHKEENGQKTQYNIIVYIKPWENVQKITDFTKLTSKTAQNQYQKSYTRTKNSPNQKSWQYEQVKVHYDEKKHQNRQNL